MPRTERRPARWAVKSAIVDRLPRELECTAKAEPEHEGARLVDVRVLFYEAEMSSNSGTSFSPQIPPNPLADTKMTESAAAAMF